MSEGFSLLQRVICRINLIHGPSIVVPAGSRGAIVDFQAPDQAGRRWYTVRWEADPGDFWDMREDEMTADPYGKPLSAIGREA